jgi:1-acyl-sn-glycerol-3-phosphate acyltransferase
MKDSEPAPYLLRCYRYIRLLLQLLSGLLTVALLFPFYRRERRWRAVQRWSAGVIRGLGMEVVVHGRPPQAPRALLGVSNHVSWADIQLIHSVWRVRFVAKSEVRDWPAIGWLSARTGTLFIERGRHRHAAKINRDIHRAFAEGDAIAVFPEGTTSDGRELLRFHASLLQPAVDERALVVPVALRYLREDGGIDTAPAYVGEASLMDTLSAMVARRRIRAEVHFLSPIDAAGLDRRALAVRAHEAIAQVLSPRTADRRSGTVDDLPAAPPTAAGPTGIRCPAPGDSP